MISNNLIDVNILPEELIPSLVTQMYIEEVLHFNKNIHKQYSNKSGNTIGCGCPYCLTLHRYVNIKKLIHRIKKRISDDNYVYINSETEIEDKKYLQSLEKMRNSIKEEKDNLKRQLKL